MHILNWAHSLVLNDFLWQRATAQSQNSESLSLGEILSYFYHDIGEWGTAVIAWVSCVERTVKNAGISRVKIISKQTRLENILFVVSLVCVVVSVCRNISLCPCFKLLFICHLCIWCNLE
jgi:hypothetical protein